MRDEIREGNILIAKFMTDEPEVLERDLQKAGTVESMHYHDEWDWIMPVVTKIIGVLPPINDIHHSFYWSLSSVSSAVVTKSITGFPNFIGEAHEVTDLSEEGLKRANYRAIVGFIKWYNENK